MDVIAADDVPISPLTDDLQPVGGGVAVAEARLKRDPLSLKTARHVPAGAWASGDLVAVATVWAATAPDSSASAVRNRYVVSLEFGLARVPAVLLSAMRAARRHFCRRQATETRQIHLNANAVIAPRPWAAQHHQSGFTQHMGPFHLGAPQSANFRNFVRAMQFNRENIACL